MKKEQETKQEFDNQDFIPDSPDSEADGRFEGADPETDKVTDEAPADAVNPAAVAEDTDWKDKYMRLSAEFDNYRKRTLKEKLDLISTGGEEVIVSILSVLDDFDRAVDAMERSNDIESARQGVKLIRQRLVDTLKQKGVSEIESNGATFDTDLHEAVTRFPSEDQKGKVIDTVRKGYRMNDKVIRFCKVVVGE